MKKYVKPVIEVVDFTAEAVSVDYYDVITGSGSGTDDGGAPD